MHNVYSCPGISLHLKEQVCHNRFTDNVMWLLCLQEFGGGTSRGKPLEKPLDVLTSVAGQQKVILGLSQKQTGMFLNWDGKRLDY